MTEQTEAQRLADELVALHGYPLSIKAAAELRRLDAELKRKSEAIQRLWAERDSLRTSMEQLLKALEPDRQLLQQALDALQGLADYRYTKPVETTMKALSDRLAHCDRCGKKMGGEGDIHTCTPKPEQEPVSCLSKTQAKAILGLALDLEKTGRMVVITHGQERTDFVARNRNIQCALEDALRNATTPPAAQPELALEGMPEFLADLTRSRTKYPANGRMFDGLMGEIDELRRAYAGDGDVRAEAFDVAVCAYRIATEGDAGGNALLTTPPAAAQQEPVALIRTWHKNGDQHAELVDWGMALQFLPDGEHCLYTPPAAAQPEQEPVAFEKWWEDQGQFCRAGGWEYVAFRAWEAALATPPAQPAPVQDQKSCKLCTHEQRHYMEMTGPCRACRFYSNFASATPPAAAQPAAWEHHAKKLTQWLHCMSYNDSYFGEPAGLVKQVTASLNRLIGATPPAAQRTWVGLTDAELADMHATLMVKLRGCYETKDLYKAIEAKLKEKNNG